MGLFVLDMSKEQSVNTKIKTAIANIELHIDHYNSSHILDDFVLPLLKVALSLQSSIELKDISWSEELPPDCFIRYNHIKGSHPLDGFTIEWKGWEDSITYTLSNSTDCYFDAFFTIEEAKQAAQQYINNLIKECIL